MELLLTWIFLSVVVGFIGFTRQGGFYLPFVVSILFTPVVGLMVALTSRQSINPYKPTRRVVKPKPAEVEKEYGAELAHLESLYQEGKLTVYEYEYLTDALRRKKLRVLAS